MDASNPRSTTPRGPPASPVQNHRLLYRGALALPDSHILLEGLTFTLNLGGSHATAPRTLTPGAPLALMSTVTPTSKDILGLLDSPLPLALESMRGRPTLRFEGVTKVADVWLDESVLVNLHILPECFLTRQYFENLFCATLITSPTRTTEYGVRVALGDSHHSDILIFGRLSPTPPTVSATMSSPTHHLLKSFNPKAPPPILKLFAARITSDPPPVALPTRPRPPRPDDPTPRKPPLFSLGLSGVGAKRHASLEDVVRGAKKRRTGLESSSDLLGAAQAQSLAELGKKARPGVSAREREQGFPVFKIPAVPSRKAQNGKGKGRAGAGITEDEDVFGMPSALLAPPTATGKGKGKTKATGPSAGVSEPSSSGPGQEGEGESPMERDNKNAIKKSVMLNLAGRGVAKEHAAFKEVFNAVYRGTCFALRARMKAAPIDGMVIGQLVGIHVGMYVSMEG